MINKEKKVLRGKKLGKVEVVLTWTLMLMRSSNSSLAEEAEVDQEDNNSISNSTLAVEVVDLVATNNNSSKDLHQKRICLKTVMFLNLV